MRCRLSCVLITSRMYSNFSLSFIASNVFAFVAFRSSAGVPPLPATLVLTSLKVSDWLLSTASLYLGQTSMFRVCITSSAAFWKRRLSMPVVVLSRRVLLRSFTSLFCSTFAFSSTDLILSLITAEIPLIRPSDASSM